MLIHEDKKSGINNLSVSWKDPEIAAQWANDLVKQLNEQLREQAIQDSKKRVGYLEQELAKTTLKDMREVLYSLLESEKQKAMLANVNEDFALEVIDPAVAPEVSEKPKRKLIVALGGVCGGFLGIFAVFFLQFLRKAEIFQQRKHQYIHMPKQFSKISVVGLGYVGLPLIPPIRPFGRVSVLGLDLDSCQGRCHQCRVSPTLSTFPLKVSLSKCKQVVLRPLLILLALFPKSRPFSFVCLRL